MKALNLAFDFDGVIADSMPAQAEVWTQAAITCGQNPEGLLLNLYRGNAGPRMFEGLDIPNDRMTCLRRVKDDLWHRKQTSVSLFPGTVTALRAVSEIARLAIASTASQEYIEVVLSKGAVMDRFSAIVTDSDALAPKPDPALLYKVASELGCPLKKLWMVGDTKTDYDMSKAAGCRFLFFAPDHQPRDGVDRLASPAVQTWADLAMFFATLVDPV